MKNLLLILLLTSSLQSIAEIRNGCIDVITYGLNPKTGEWQTFPTPCDVPEGWVKSYTKPSICLDVIVYAQNPKTKNWYKFSTPCDVPNGWISSNKVPKTFREKSCAGTVSQQGVLYIPLIYYEVSDTKIIQYKDVELQRQDNHLLYQVTKVLEIGSNK